MCGIAGFYSKNKNISIEELHSMADSLVHRGPDNDGIYYNETLGLAHRRLRIIDLSDAANQPMTCPCEKFRIVFNGEIYNFDEVRREQGWEVRTASDTEILLRAMKEWKEKAFEQLNGMFAFALYDVEEDELWLARDRVGIKPLYYYWDGEDLAFASELKALKRINRVQAGLQLNKFAINEFLHLGYIPEPRSIYKYIFKLPAGSYLRLKNNKITIQKYWDVKDHFTPDLISNEIQAREMLRDLINDSVRLRLKADVPYGTFLSGGIDSSLVTAIAQRNVREPIKTFSIGFKDNQHDESIFAKKVAEYIKTDHHELIVTEKEAIDLMPSILESYDEPYADSSAIPTMLVSQMARKEVSMSLSGDGGDELFYGYGAYNWAQRLSDKKINALRKPMALGLSVLGSKYKRIAEMLTYNDHDTLPSHIFSQEQYFFSRSQLKELLTQEYYNSFHLDEYPIIQNRSLSAIENQALFDFQYYLRDDLLTKIDRASMKYSLEARVPLLDHNVVEFAARLSPGLKMKNGVQKYLLKQVLYEYVPAELFDRPKWGFSIPLKRWLKHDLRFLIESYLSRATIEKHHVVHYAYVEKLKKAFLGGKQEYLYNRLWQLIILHMFLDNN